MGNKYRKKVSTKLIAIVRAKDTKVISKPDYKLIPREHILSPSDRLVWVYKANSKHKVIEITTVSYVTKIQDVDYTVVYFDNSHEGIMHKHVRVSISNDSDTPIPLKVKKGGNQNKLLNWALKDIRDNWYYYRRKFYLRSKLKPDF